MHISLQRKNLDDVKMRVQFGFFYLGYKPQYYFWEFAIMFRKIIIIYVTLIPDSAIKSKAVLVLFFIAVSFYFHSKSKPYTNENLNKLDNNTT